ncbi:MAG: NUDIX hydrolase [Methylobacteriaceae bacterium]|nr:NUDIX hydrolase [Methylobacteriaceae bacterium]MBV9634293.1 NUDIX hydrolase [Methylobacteriaceae bacterium]
MADQWTEEACRRKYESLVRSRPQIFGPHQSGAYRILLDRELVERAQAEAARYRAAHGLACEDLRVGVLADDPYVLVMREAVEFPDGRLGLYNRLHVPASVVVMPMLNGDIVLINRYRHGTRAWHYEFPRGIIEEGEDLEACVRRELAEEIGASALDVRRLGGLHASSGITNEYSDIVAARIAGFGRPDAHEAIMRIDAVAPGEFRRMIGAGEITDGQTLAGYAYAVAAGLL